MGSAARDICADLACVVQTSGRGFDCMFREHASMKGTCTSMRQPFTDSTLLSRWPWEVANVLFVVLGCCTVLTHGRICCITKPGQTIQIARALEGHVDEHTSLVYTLQHDICVEDHSAHVLPFVNLCTYSYVPLSPMRRFCPHVICPLPIFVWRRSVDPISPGVLSKPIGDLSAIVLVHTTCTGMYCKAFKIRSSSSCAICTPSVVDVLPLTGFRRNISNEKGVQSWTVKNAEMKGGNKGRLAFTTHRNRTLVGYDQEVYVCTCGSAIRAQEIGIRRRDPTLCQKLIPRSTYILQCVRQDTVSRHMYTLVHRLIPSLPLSSIELSKTLIRVSRVYHPDAEVDAGWRGTISHPRLAGQETKDTR